MTYIEHKNANEPLVSVYCMTYNHADTVSETIDSILSQKTDFPFEIIIHDDASTDGTADIVRSYAEKYPDRISAILQSENQFHNCNILKTHIAPVLKGRFVAICEGDDYFSDPLKLQIQADYMRENPDCTMCFHAVEQLMPDGQKFTYRPIKKDSLVDVRLIIRRGGLFCPTVSLMVTREIINKWPEFRDAADVYDYPMQILAATLGKAYYIDRLMGVYRFAFQDSWTAKRQNIVDYKHLENEEKWLELFNEYTGNEYLDAVNYHLAHLWFTEFRKTFEKSVKDRAKPYINALKFKDKLMFKTLFAAFTVLGKRGNKLLQKFKEIVLK